VEENSETKRELIREFIKWSVSERAAHRTVYGKGRIERELKPRRTM